MPQPNNTEAGAWEQLQYQVSKVFVYTLNEPFGMYLTLHEILLSTTNLSIKNISISKIYFVNFQHNWHL